MKIKLLFIAFSLAAVLFISACSGGQDNGLPEESKTPSPTKTTDSGDSIVIPTPSATPVSYDGEQKSYDDLLAELKQAYPAANWTQSNKAKDQVNNSEEVFVSKDFCKIHVYESFQTAVDNDSGYWFEYWTTLGSFGQFGIILIGESSCLDKTSAVISYPGFGKPDAETEVLTARAENINYCLTRLSACFLDGGVKLPENGSSTFNKTLTELDELAKAGFCADIYFSSFGAGGKNSCEASTDISGIQEGDLITEVAMDLDILRSAAQTPSKQSDGKYMIYGDGWAVFIYGSSESHKQAFIEMNEVIKGTLIAKH